MSYIYQDRVDNKLVISEGGNPDGAAMLADGWVCIAIERKGHVRQCADLPAAERQAAAQALAGDRYEINERLADWERELLDKQTRIDPADVKVGDVVEVEAADGSWLARGEVKDTAQKLMPYNPIGINSGIGIIWPNLTGATVRLVRRAEPEPDPEQVEALAEVMRSLPPIQFDSSEEYARELVRRGVIVRKDT